MAIREEKDNVIPFPIAASEYENAADWLARLDRGLKDGDHAKLVEWLQQSQNNASALFELADFWDQLDLLSGLKVFFPLQRRSKNRNSRKRLWRVAAAILLTVCSLVSALYVKDTYFNASAYAIAQFEQTFETTVGELVTELLPDGSSITLNTNTELHVIYQDSNRIVELNHGEAHFTVAHDTERPFGVRVGGHIVQAVGTAFNVRKKDSGEVEVTVTEGIVQILDEEKDKYKKDARDGIADSDPAVQPHIPGRWWTNSILGTGLVEGQMALLDSRLLDAAKKPEIQRLEPVDIEIKLAWQRGVLIFEGEPLEEVLKEFSRYTTTNFALVNVELSDVRVGGYFKAGDIDGLLLTLNENFKIKSERITDKQILLFLDK